MTIPDRPAGSHCYRLFGLMLRSEIALPELRTAPGGEADVTIIRGPVAQIEGERTQGLIVTPDGAQFDVAGVARFLIRDGNSITVEADPQASGRDLCLYLLGSALSAVLHQRGMLPLHANAIDMGGRAIAFCGRSGAGKSTLAAAFHDRGRPLLTDDICVVTRREPGFVVQPGIPRVRLWRDAVERSGRDAAVLDPAFAGRDKYVLPIGESHADAPLPLAAIYALGGTGDPDSGFAINRLGGFDATQVLVQRTYRRAYVPLIGDPHRHFEACVALSRGVPVFGIQRPWNGERIGEMIDLVEAHFSEL
jgi:hypothetical protein